MTSIDFYVLSDGPENALELLACKLSEKALKAGNQIFIQTSDESQTGLLSELLWSHKPASFLPHELATELQQESSATSSPICIGHKEAPEQCEQLLINLSQKIPPAYARFERVLELVPPQQEARAALRENYGHYKDRGYPIKTHEISL
ncbi:MAG: DNA polymerase III subunit chi [Porticoccaceae bacterium]|jgi:DNA polymerase III subunit chi|nr:DNA polymerase III subunit chi [Porticoccaceae bacterium]